jgi:integrase
MTAIRKRIWTAPSGEPKSAWLVDYRDQAGKRRSKQFARKKDADAWLTQAAWEVSKGLHTADSQSVSVSDATSIWLKMAEANERERGTIEQYETIARLHINPLIGAEKLSKLSQPKVEAYRDMLLKTRSRAMTGKAVRALSRIIGEAMRRGLVAQNVAASVRVARTSRDRARVVIPSKAELKAIIHHSGDLRPLIMTAIFAGLRASELRGLRWADVDLKRNVITVTQRADKYCQIGPPKSEAGYRTIPISLALSTELKAWKLKCPISEQGLAFPNSAGGVRDYGHLLRRKFYPLQIAAGVSDPVVINGVQKVDDKGKAIVTARYGLHSLRHAAASAWIKQRIDLKRLQTWMGHASVQITLDTYGHLIADDTGDAALIEAAHAELLA